MQTRGLDAINRPVAFAAGRIAAPARTTSGRWVAGAYYDYGTKVHSDRRFALILGTVSADHTIGP